MVFHKVLTPADGEKGIKVTKQRRFVLTKVVLEHENTAAALLIRNGQGDKWSPLEFLDSSKKRTADLNLAAVQTQLSS
jgi:hypothetical protein